MITPTLIERFLASAPPQPLRDGTRYAEQARVGSFIGSGSSVSTVVRGRHGEHEVVLWSEGNELRHRCECDDWREPCRHEIPELISLYRRSVGEGLRVIGVSVDGGDPAAVAKFAVRHKIPYEVWHDPDDHASAALGVATLPATFLYDRSGRLAWHGHVPHGGSKDLEQQLGLALAEGRPAR